MRLHTLGILAWLIVTQATRAAAPPRFDVDRYGDPLPSGAVARLGTVRLRPVEARSMALSPDGKVIATGEEGYVRLWDFATGRQIRSWEVGSRTDVRHLQFGPGGEWLIAAGDPYGRSFLSRPFVIPTWRVYHIPLVGPAASARDLKVPLMPGSVLGLLDGHRLLVGQEAGDGARVGVWDLRSGEPMFFIPDATAFACAPDGKRLLVGTKDGKVRVFGGAGWKVVRSWRAHHHALASMAVSPRGDLIATFGPPQRGYAEDAPPSKEADLGVRLWDTAGKLVRPLAGRLPGITGLHFSPDGKRLVGLRFGSALSWDVETGRAEDSSPDICHDIAFAPDGEVAAALGGWHLSPGHQIIRSRGSIWLWRDGAPARRCVSEPMLGASSLSFTPDGKHVLALDGHPRVWDRRTGKEPHAGAGHDHPVVAMRLRADGVLLSRDGDGGRRSWDAPSGKPLPSRLDEASVPGWSFDRHPPRDAWTDTSAGLRVVPDLRAAHVHDASTGAMLHTLTRKEKHHWDGYSHFQPLPRVGGRLWIACSLDPKYSSWGLLCPETGQMFECLARPSSWSISPDGHVIAAAYHVVELRETLTGGLLGTIPRGHLGNINASAFSSDGSLLATGSSDTTVLVWDWRHVCGIFPLDAEPEAAWRELGSADARRAHSALLRLSRPDALPTLARRLRPVTAADCRAIREALLRIDDDDFEVRSAATASLAGSGADVFFLLHEALAKRPTLYAVKCIEKIIDAAPRCWSPDMLRRLRAVAALERIATPAARALLRRIAEGEPRARLTRDARAALAR